MVFDMAIGVQVSNVAHGPIVIKQNYIMYLLIIYCVAQILESCIVQYIALQLLNLSRKKLKDLQSVGYILLKHTKHEKHTFN